METKENLPLDNDISPEPKITICMAVYVGARYLNGNEIQASIHFGILHPKFPFVKHHFVLNPTNHKLPTKTASVWCSQRFDARNRRKLRTACNPVLADYTTHRTTPASVPDTSTL